ncbi:MAG TPA: exodeoxyribonuclease V subunit alpha [Acidimicrobiales bacterium]|jgi:exodeoxyribonuclease V alpha subunit|nr:exodeoxyribonuclease V subunit alpha [Acidimicrobiales bacterium]
MTLRTATGPSGRPVVVPAGADVLRPFIEAGVFGAYEVQFAAAVLRLQPGLADEELLALAVASRAPRFGHVCTPLDAMAVRLAELDGEETDDLPWPSADVWAAGLTRSSIVSLAADPTDGPLRPLVWDGDRLYLHRYWHYELAIADDLLRRCMPVAPDSSTRWSGPDADDVDRVLDSLFGADGTEGPDLQRLAAQRALGPGVSIIAGGPGTGKTYTVARLLTAAHLVAAEQGRLLSVALAAPTGKAAARMGEAVQAALEEINLSGELGGVGGMVAATAPTTIHSLLGWADRTHFRHDREQPLPEDMVIIDETSMVSLPLMAKLLDAVRPEASVVLVGDPYQLASIEAGTVMSDVVGPAGDPEMSEDPVVSESLAPGSVAGVQTLWDSLAAPVPEPVGAGVLTDRVTMLRTMRRFGGDSTIAALADAVRTGDRARALDLLEEGATDLRWVRPDDAEQLGMVTGELVEVGEELVVAAARGDGPVALDAAGRVKVLAATRRGPNGMAEWTGRIEQGVALLVADFHPDRRWHVGRPVLVTANDRANGVFNGDTGVVVNGDEGMEVVLTSGDALRHLAPSRLDRVETWWAMTIHKSQGSEFPHAVVALPEHQSPILTRELLYTAVTRARERLTVVAGADALEQAIARPLARASGLRSRLWPV